MTEHSKKRRRPNVAFLSYGSAWVGLYPGSKYEGILKIATVFYDRLVLPVTSDHLDGIVSVFAKEGIDPKKFDNVWLPFDRYIPTKEEQLVFSSQLVGGRFVHDDVFSPSGGYVRGFSRAIEDVICETLEISHYRAKEIKKSQRIEYIREANGIMVSAFGAARCWALLQPYLSCSLLCFNEVESRAAARLLMSAPLDHGGLLYEPVQALVPSVRSLPWPEVLELRRDRRVRSFRSWLATRAREGPAEVSTNEALDLLWAAFADLSPSTTSEIIRAVLGIAPVPLAINPIGIALAGHSVFRVGRMRRKHQWLMFLHSMYQAAKKDAEYLTEAPRG